MKIWTNIYHFHFVARDSDPNMTKEPDPSMSEESDENDM